MNRRVLYVLAIVVASAAVAAIHTGFAQTRSPQKQRVTYFPNRSPQAPYSSAVLAGNTLYVAGVIGIDPKTLAPPERIEDEIKNLLDAYKIVLGRAGFGMDDLVDVQVFCTDLSYGGRFNAIYRTYFSKQLPARVFIGVTSLAAGGHFEMHGIAVRH